MQRIRFADEQIVEALKAYEAGLPTADICKKHGISETTFYEWRSTYGSVEASDVGKLKALEDENRHLKKLLAEAMLDIATLREMLAKNL